MNPTKLCSLLLILNGLLTGLPLRAQDSLQQYMRPAVVKTNLTGPFSLMLEIPTTPRQSVQLSVQRINFGLFNTTRFFNLTADYRFYRYKSVVSANRPGPNGAYLSPYLKYRTVEDETTGFFNGTKLSTVSYSMFGGGVVVGKQVIRRKGFTVDGFVGGGYFALMSYQAKIESSGASPPKVRPADYRLDVRLGLCLGLAFAQPHAPATEPPGQVR